jgi:hypothetical protein
MASNLELLVTGKLKAIPGGKWEELLPKVMAVRDEQRITAMFATAAGESLPLRKLPAVVMAINEAVKFVQDKMPANWEGGADLMTPCIEALVLAAGTPSLASNCQYIRDFCCSVKVIDSQFCYIAPMLNLYQGSK